MTAGGTGTVAVSGSGGASSGGTDIGVQVIGPAYGDRITIGVARLLEAEGFAFTPPPAFV